MLLSELEFKEYDNQYWLLASIPGSEYYVFRRISNSNFYAISEMGRAGPDWFGIDALTAQAVLFHLTKEHSDVTE